MTLEEAVETACRDLPEGWIIRLCMENGAAYVDLVDSLDHLRESAELDDYFELPDLIRAGVTIARREA
jgi:hypothetical protein